MEISLEERLSALENQSYVMYLQLNGITKILIDKGIVDKEDLTKEMDDLNTQLFEVTKEMREKELQENPSLKEAVAAQAE